MRLPKGIDIITIYGPTASGKTAIAVQLAEMIRGVLFSGDSRQVYRGMDLGTGKDLEEYQVGDYTVPYRLIDIAEAGETYNLQRYIHDFHDAYQQLPTECPKILCGGTGLYITAVLSGYKMPKVPINTPLREELSALSLEELKGKLAEYGAKVTEGDSLNPRRIIRAIEKAVAGQVGTEAYPPLSGPIFCIDIDRDLRRARISERLTARLNAGMIEEVQQLLNNNVAPEVLYAYGLEYKHITLYLQGKVNYQEMHNKLEVAIHQFAKRQMTWARGMARKGFKIEHITPLATPRATAEAMRDIIIYKYQ